MRGARDAFGVTDLEAVFHVGEQLRGIVAVERDQARQQAVLAVRVELAHGLDGRDGPASPCWPPSATPCEGSRMLRNCASVKGLAR